MKEVALCPAEIDYIAFGRRFSGIFRAHVFLGGLKQSKNG
jgi:hypothetical protein